MSAKFLVAAIFQTKYILENKYINQNQPEVFFLQTL